MADEPTCPECGTHLPADAPGGLCPKCLLKAGFPSGGRHLHIRCPHCHEAVELVDEAPLVEITCPSCDSRFSLVDQETLLAESDAPTKIGRFRLLNKLGVGAFGSVWRARDPELDRDVAVKIPRKEQLTAVETEMFVREARSAAQLRHPNVVQVHEVGRENGRVYIVSDLVEGITLADRLTAGRPTHRESAELLRKMAEALAAAHAAGVVHRDLKPSNVLLDERGEPHVTDFGLAKRDAGEITMTVEGRVLGTPAYMSPEQAKGDGHSADARSDVYSLGAMLFELLTGEKPFRGNTTMLLHQVIHDDPPRPRKLDGTVPRDLETIALKCLEKDPARRYQTARELADDLGRWLVDDPIRARPIGRFERTRRWCRRNRVVALLATAIVLSLLIGLATTFWQWGIASDNFAAAEAARTEERTQRELAVRRGEETKVALDDSRGRLARLYVERGTRDIETDPHGGLPWLLQAYHTAPEGSEVAAMHRLRLGLLVGDVPDLARFWPEGAAATFSPDGRRLAVAVGHEAYVFELPDLRRLGPFAHERPVVGLNFSPDGERLVTRSEGEGAAPLVRPNGMPARIWDVRTGLPLGPERDLHDPRVARNFGALELLFSPDGERVLVVNYGLANRWYTQMSIRVHDGRTLEPLGGEFLHHHRDEWIDYTVSPDRTRVLTLHGVPFRGARPEDEEWPESYTTPRVWDVMTGEPVTDFFATDVDARDGTFDADGARVLIAGKGGALLFEAATGTPIRTYAGPAELHRVEFHPNGRHVVGLDAHRVHTWDAETGEPATRYPWRWDHHDLFQFDATGRRYVMGDGTLADWPFGNDDRQSVSIAEPYSGRFSGDGSRLLTEQKSVHLGSRWVSGKASVLRVVDGHPLTPLWRFDGGRQSGDDALSRDGRFLVQRDDSGVWLWDLDARPRLLRPVERFDPLDGLAVRDVAFDENGGRMVVLDGNGEVTTWDTAKGTPAGPTFRPEGEWSRLVLEPSGDRVAVVGRGPNVVEKPTDEEVEFEMDAGLRSTKVWNSDRDVQVWDVTTGRAVTSPLPHRTVTQVRFTPDGGRLMVVGRFGLRQEKTETQPYRGWTESELSVWDLANGRSLVDRRRSDTSVVLQGFTQDGSRLAATSTRELPNPDPGTLYSKYESERIEWSTEDWREVESTSLERSAAFAEDVAGPIHVRTHEGRLTAVEFLTGREIATFRGTVNDEIAGWTFSPDGERIAVVVKGDTFGLPARIRQWNLTTGEPISTPMAEPSAAWSPLLAYHPEGRILAVADNDRLRLWDAESGLPLTAALPFAAREDERRPFHGRELRFSPGGERLYHVRGGTIWTLPLAEAIAAIPSDDPLAAWSRVLSAHRIDEAGGYVPLTPDEIREAVATLQVAP